MKDDTFVRLYSALVKYKEEFGHLRIPQNYVVDEYRLGRMVSAIRNKQYHLDSQQCKKLEELGFIWEKHHKKRLPMDIGQVIELLLAYKQEHGHIDIPTDYVNIDGIKLGALVNNIRTGSRKTTEEEKKQLNQIGFYWISENSRSFEKLYHLLLEYKEEYGNLHIKLTYETPTGKKLGRMVHYVKCGKRKLSESQKKQLDDIGFIWKGKKNNYQFDEIYSMLQKFKEEYGTCDVPNRYKTPDNVWLGMLVYRIRTGSKKISEEEKAKLNELGFV